MEEPTFSITKNMSSSLSFACLIFNFRYATWVSKASLMVDLTRGGGACRMKTNLVGSLFDYLYYTSFGIHLLLELKGFKLQWPKANHREDQSFSPLYLRAFLGGGVYDV